MHMLFSEVTWNFRKAFITCNELHIQKFRKRLDWSGEIRSIRTVDTSYISNFVYFK